MSTASRPVRWLIPAFLLVAWLAVGGAFGPYAGKLGEVATNDQASFLPQSAESTQVIDAQKAFSRQETVPAIVVWTSEKDGGRLDPGQREAATAALAGLKGEPGVTGEVSPALPSKDGQALEGVVQLRSDLGDGLPDALAAVQEAADRVPG
ncbi:MMPL family transporter, partial [Streptomyces sp. PpalLS-921]